KPVSEVPIRPPASKREWRDDFDDRHDQSVWRGRLASVRPRVLRFRATKYYVKGIADPSGWKQINITGHENDSHGLHLGVERRTVRTRGQELSRTGFDSKRGRHDDRILRLLRLRDRRRSDLSHAVLPKQRPDERTPRLLRNLLNRLLCAPARRHRVRSLRRPHRPQDDTCRRAPDHGRL